MWMYFDTGGSQDISFESGRNIRWFSGLISYAARDLQLKDYGAFEVKSGDQPLNK